MTFELPKKVDLKERRTKRHGDESDLMGGKVIVPQKLQFTRSRRSSPIPSWTIDPIVSSATYKFATEAAKMESWTIVEWNT
jgi:hypothetical protein